MSSSTERIRSNKEGTTSNYREIAQNLQNFLLGHLPLARAAGVVIDSYDGDVLTASAPLENNINDKLTAFGGSLYNLCVIAAWGITHLKAQELEMEGDIVVAKGEINYLRPLRNHLVAKAFSPNDKDLEKAVKFYKARGKGVFTVHAEIRDDAGELCVEFFGKYAVVKPA